MCFCFTELSMLVENGVILFVLRGFEVAKALGDWKKGRNRRVALTKFFCERSTEG